MNTKRVNIFKTEPEAYKALLALAQQVESSELTAIQKELIKIRASQINGCAFCLDMHTTDAMKLGETTRRINTVSAWRDTSFFTEEEQAILALTEEVTLIQNHVSDDTYQHAVNVLGEKRVAQVILNTTVINAWNRIAIATHLMPPA
jgi:AhpD family alkylhydroperoxidase